MVCLRTYTFIDSLQPQLAAELGRLSAGGKPQPYDASIIFETSPGIVIHRVLDSALKTTRVEPSLVVVERHFGMLEVHHEDKGDVMLSGESMLDRLGLDENDRLTPKIVTNQIIRGIEPTHAQYLNRELDQPAIEPGQSLFILETDPAGYIVIAANEAEKAARVNLLEVRPYGAYGRLYLAGPESEIDSAALAASQALEALGSR